MKIPRTYRINTKRCILKCISEQDIPYVFSATRFEEFNDGMVWEPPQAIEELKEPLKKSLQAWDAGLAYTFTIECANTTAFLGRISIRKDKAKGGQDAHPTRDVFRMIDLVQKLARKKDTLLESLTAQL
jgi:[ribosomal protein S5]-alanine N-acetyltransferase